MQVLFSRSLWLWVFLVFLTGCASNPSISSLSSETRAKVSQIIFLESGTIPQESYEVLGSVEGLACKRNLYASGAPSFEEARQGVKIRAAQLGANAIINILCEENQKVDWGRNCWQSVICVGDAIAIKDLSIISRSKEENKSPGTITSGTGWIVEPGFIVTNQHVISGAKKIIGHFKGGEALALTVIASDPINDLALLQPNLHSQLPRPLPLAKNEASLGEAVFTVGFPHTDILGTSPKVTNGIISSKSGLRDDLRLYQTSVQLQSGNSGGPLVNMRGEVVGITTSKLDAVRVFKYTGDLPEGINYAVKSQYIAALIASVSEDKGYLNKTSNNSFNELNQAVNAVQDSVLLIEAQ